MKADEKTLVTVTAEIDVPVEKVWQYWTKPEHIIRWNFASDDWHCPWAKSINNIFQKHGPKHFKS